MNPAHTTDAAGELPRGGELGAGADGTAGEAADTAASADAADAAAGAGKPAAGTPDGGTPDGGAERIGRDQRWRLMLGADAPRRRVPLSGRLEAMDRALAALYDDGTGRSRRGGLGGSSPDVARWLGDIRAYFPNRVVKVMQTDAIERLGLRSLLMEPEILESVEPDIHLVATLASLSKVIPESSKESARKVVARTARDVEERLTGRLDQAVRGALNRASRTDRPRPADIDWNRTIAANLKNYLPEHRTVVPERLVGYGRRRLGVQRELVICLDQSGSMATSVVYASILACVLATIGSLSTTLVAYSTDVADLTERLADPVDVVFGAQLGGGTDTSPAIDYCAQRIGRPSSSILILVSDLYDAKPEAMLSRIARMVASGVQVIALLALSDDGVPSYNRKAAADLAAMGVPAFGCTPDAFPDLLAAAIERQDLSRWAEERAAAEA